MAKNKHISDQLLAAYLDGNTSPAETLEVLEALKQDSGLREVLDVSISVEKDNEAAIDVLPMMEYVAENPKKICSVLCEMFVLNKRHIQCKHDTVWHMIMNPVWITQQGVPLHSIGNILTDHGLMITRKYNSAMSDIISALSDDNDVIVVVDSDKLYSGRVDLEDAPNHAIVVLGVERESIHLFDPSEKEQDIIVSQDVFMKAWKESKNYMIRVLRNIDDYTPHPIYLEDIPLTDDLIELREAIAENAHEVWAAARKREGWTYGKVRDDEHKKHPDLIPYSALPDSEKEYDRIMALNTIKLVRKLGFEIVKNKK